MRIVMLPNDVLFLNSGREFSAGETHLGVTQPFVPPHTVAGAIRSALYLRDPSSFDGLIRPGEEEPGFEILGVFFLRDEELLPLPADVVEDENGDITPVSIEGDVVTASESIHFTPATGFLRMKDLLKYLKGEHLDFTKVIVPQEEVYTFEDRIGIGLTDEKTTAEGLLYRTRNLRLREGTGISVWLGENGEVLRSVLGREGLLRLGGEGRFVRYSFDDAVPELPGSDVQESDLLKLYVATPLILTDWKNGKAYSTWDPRKELAKALNIEEERIRIRWFFSGGILPLTGWDMKNKHPKAVRYAVSPGSVYYVEIEGGLSSLPGYMKLGELTRLGYGLVLPGRAKKGRGDGNV